MTSLGASPPAHCSRHAELALHDTEHAPVHTTVQVAPAVHDTLPAAPTVTSHELPMQLMLHAAPHAPLHDASSGHDSVQPSSAHVESSSAHALPGSHAHALPVHVGGGASPPQALAKSTRPRRAARTAERGRIARG